jgi:hypothetical protein
MFDKVGQPAEWMAVRVPRRAFLRKMVQVALPMAAAIGGGSPRSPCPPTHPNAGPCPFGVLPPYC